MVFSLAKVSHSLSFLLPMQVLDQYYPEILLTSPSIGRQGKVLRREQKKCLSDFKQSKNIIFSVLITVQNLREHYYVLQLRLRCKTTQVGLSILSIYPLLVLLALKWAFHIVGISGLTYYGD